MQKEEEASINTRVIEETKVPCLELILIPSINIIY